MAISTKVLDEIYQLLSYIHDTNIYDVKDNSHNNSSYNSNNNSSYNSNNVPPKTIVHIHEPIYPTTIVHHHSPIIVQSAPPTTIINNNYSDGKVAKKEKKEEKDDEEYEHPYVAVALLAVGLPIATYAVSSDYKNYVYSCNVHELMNTLRIRLEGSIYEDEFKSVVDSYVKWGSRFNTKYKQSGGSKALMTLFFMGGAYGLAVNSRGTKLGSSFGLILSGCYLLWNKVTNNERVEQRHHATFVAKLNALYYKISTQTVAPSSF